MPRRALVNPAVLLAVALALGGALFLAGPSPFATLAAPPAATGLPPPELPVRTPYRVENGVIVIGEVVVRNRDLRGRTWAGAFLWRTTFDHCDLRNADLRGADLVCSEFWACDLRGARLEGAALQGSRYDRLTRWPAGFRPEMHGARLVE